MKDFPLRKQTLLEGIHIIMKVVQEMDILNSIVIEFISLLILDLMKFYSFAFKTTFQANHKFVIMPQNE